MEEETVPEVIDRLACSLWLKGQTPGIAELGHEAMQRLRREVDLLRIDGTTSNPITGTIRADHIRLFTSPGYYVHLRPAPEEAGPLIVRVFASHRNGAPTRAVVGTYLT